MVVKACFVKNPSAVTNHVLRVSMGFTAAIALTACVASGRSTDLAHRPAVMPAPSGAVTDVWYDWHGLLIMPFGTLLKDSPVPLHEVYERWVRKFERQRLALLHDLKKELEGE